MKCPVCRKEAPVGDYQFEYDKRYGRLGRCPNCHEKITQTKQAKGLVRTESGQLIRSVGRRRK